MLALPRSRLPVLGVAVLVGFALHAAVSAARGEPWNLLWACNLATVGLAVGCLARHPRLVAVAAMWLAVGAPLWAVDLALGGTMVSTSILIHVAAPIVAFVAARTLGVPRGSWLVAGVAAGSLILLSRALTPPRLNVNLAYGVYPGWERLFPDPRLYPVAVAAVLALGFAVVERCMRRRASIAGA